MPIDFNDLKESYGFECANCGYEQRAAPSLAMKCFHENSGHGTCLGCGTFLRLRIDETGEKMVSQIWDEYLKSVQVKKIEPNEPPHCEICGETDPAKCPHFGN